MDITRFKYSHQADLTNWKDKVTWMLEHFGPIGERWEYDRSEFLFLSEKDLMLFQIAWG